MTKVAILGFGVVGSGVAEVLAQNAAHIAGKAACGIETGYILDIRSFPDSPFSGLITSDFGVIENDPDVSVVAEVIGGTGAAYEFTKRALAAGKSVVTSNKELVAKHGAELLAMARARGVQYLFEASVGGGIPIIRPLWQCLAANRITDIYGILNGTCNYILTRMAKDGKSFDAALKEAQAAGYAEADPSADIEGRDTCRKICILASMSFGKHVYPQYVHTEGITGVTAGHIAEAAAMDCSIKLLGRASLREDGRVNILTAPHLVGKDSPLFAVSDVFNGICVMGNATGEVMFYGRGAGKLPTASAVVADIMDCVRNRVNPRAVMWQDSEGDITAPVSEFVCKTHTFSDGVTMRIL